MKIKLLPILTFLILHFVAFGQIDYTDIRFKSYIYEYKDVEPRTSELGIEKYILEDIISLLGGKYLY